MPVTTTTVKECDGCGDEIEMIADLNGNPVERPHVSFGPGGAGRLLCIYCEKDNTARAKYIALVVADAKAVVEKSRAGLQNQQQAWAVLKAINGDATALSAARAKMLETWRTVKKA